MFASEAGRKILFEKHIDEIKQVLSDIEEEFLKLKIVFYNDSHTMRISIGYHEQEEMDACDCLMWLKGFYAGCHRILND